MRRRRWVAVVAVLMIVVVSASFLALKIGSRHPAVKRAVLARILPEVGGQLSIGELEIGLASLTFGDVSIDMGPRGSVYVPAATVSLSYPELLTNGFEARSALATVIVSGPSATLRYGLPGERPTVAPDLLALGRYLPEYLGVSDATVELEDARTGRRIELSSLYLLIEKAEEDRADGSATASVLGGESNLALEFSWETLDEIMAVHGELGDAHLSRGVPLPPDLPVDPLSGLLEAAGSAVFSNDSPPVWDLSFALTDGDLLLPGELGSALDARATVTFDARGLALTLTSAEWQGASVSGRADVDVEGRALRSAELEALGLPASRVADLAGGLPFPASGLLSVDAGVAGPWDELDASLDVRSPNVVVGEADITDLAARASYGKGLLEVEDLTCGVYGGSVEVAGRLGLESDESGWAVDVMGEAVGLDVGFLATALGADGWSGAVSVGGLEFRSGSAGLNLEALVSWKDVAVGAVDIGTGAGGVMLKDDTLSGTLSTTGGLVVLSGQVKSLTSEPSVDAELTLAGVSMDSLAVSGRSPLRRMSLSGTVTAAGPLEGFSVGGSFVTASDYCDANVSVDAIVGLGDAGARATLELHSPDAVVRGVEVPFAATLRADEAGVAVDRLEIAGVGEATFEVAAGDPRELRGSVVLSEADVNDVVAVLTGKRPPPSVGGLVFASVSLGGTLESPEASGQVQIGNGRALGVRDLTAVLAATLEEGVVDIREMALSHEERTVVGVEGSADLDGEVALAVRGDGVPGPLLGGSPETLFDLSLGVGGTASSPTLDGLVEGEHGAFLGVSFDDFLARITGAAGVVRIDPLSLEKRGSYRVSATGVVPLAALSDEEGADEGTIAIDVDGDPLAFLAEVAPFVEEAEGAGSMHVLLAGARGDVTVATAHLSASGGVVTPSDIFERLDDVTVDVAVADGAITEGVIEGSVRGNHIRLESIRAEQPDDTRVRPLVVGGLDLGVLALSTDVDGVRATVPGLMLPDEIGRVVVRGEEGAPALLVHGSPDRPILRGELVFSDASFTYPLLESEGSTDLISGFEWSLRMTAGRNLWYWRPDANLQVVRGGWLDFRGAPDDGTLCVSGLVESKRGHVTYANTDFDVREAFIDFPLFCEPARFYAFAETRVEDGTTISLTMDSYEGAFTSTVPGATFDESELRLASDSPDDDSREGILSKLQYGVSFELLEAEEQETLERRRAFEVVGSQLSGRIVRPLLSPVEGRIKRALNLDLVRFDVDFVEHFIAQLDLWQAQGAGGGYQPFLTDTRVTLGKYISRDWLLSYVGHAETYEEELGDERLGLRQELGVEYEVSRNTSLSMRVVYDPSIAGWDRRISIENRFRF